MKLDLSKFKKIKSDKHSTTLQSGDGHKIVVAHAALPPKMRGELVRMPAHMADGEDVPEQDSSADSSNSSSSDSSDGELQQNSSQMPPQPNQPQVININTGGQQPAQAQSQPPQQANPTPPSQAPVDPGLARKRQLYNLRVAQNYPSSDMDPTSNLPYMFDNSGAPPQQFDQNSWGQAQQDYQQEQDRKVADSQAQTSRIQAENVARQQAGIPPLPVPNADPNQPPPSPGLPNTQASTQQMQGQGQVANDPYGNEAMSAAYSKGVGEQKAGITGEAQAQGALGAAQSGILKNQVATQQQIANNYQSHFDALDKERKNFQDDLNQSHIDPNHYLNSMGTGQKIRTAIGLVLGGMGGGLTHQGNPALQMLQMQIENDLNAQKTDLNKKANLLSANMRQFGNLRDATDMTRVMQTDIVSNQLKQAAAQAQDPIAKSRALQAAGALDMQTAPVMSQIAMRRSLTQGMEQGSVDPAMVVRAVVPPQQQEAANKQLQEAQGVMRARDNLLGSFDKLANINTVGNRVTSPLQTAKQVAAIRDPLIAGLSKETAGRFTEQDAQMIAPLFPAPGDDAQTIATKRNQLNKLISSKMSFPILNGYGIHPERMGRYGSGGQQKIQMGAPVVASK